MEASTLRGLRTGVIIVLLLALPVVALSESPAKVLSWLVALSDQPKPAPTSPAQQPQNIPLESPKTDAPFALAASPAEEGSPPSDVDEAANAGSTSPRYAAATPPAEPDAAEGASARVLRRPVYRPLAEDEQAATIRRIPAEEDLATADAAQEKRQINAALEHLQQLGATQYRLDQNGATGDFSFVCEFDAPESAQPQTFRATAASRLQAMEQVIEQIQSSRADVRLGQQDVPNFR